MRKLICAIVVLCIGCEGKKEPPQPVTGPGPGKVAVEDLKATVEDAPPAAGQNPHYVSYRAPLVPNPLIKLPIGAITPRGWLRHQLVLEADGMTGHLQELSQWLKPEGNAWLDPERTESRGWEEMPYWLKGYGDLGYVLKDEKIVKEARKWIDTILASQEPDGYFGPRINKKNRDLWPNMLALNVLQSFYEATGDERVIPFLTKYFRWQFSLPVEDFLPESWQKIRSGDNLESVHWLYNRTGEPWLLELGKRIHERTYRWDLPSANWIGFQWHGVNIAQGFREPAVYFMQANDRKYLDAAENGYQGVIGLYGQVPGGGYAADENCRPGYDDPRQATETCSWVELMHSWEMLATFTGNPLFADRCEEVAFNSFPVSLTSDFKALHYLTAPNQVQLDRRNKAPGIQNGGMMFAYSPLEHFRCCQHNVAMGWPYYAEHLWMATRDSGLAAVLYADSEVKAKVADGVEVSISEETDYPFDETVALILSTPRPVKFPVYLRVPRWCQGARFSVNGKPVEVDSKPLTYVRLDRTWSNGDKVRIDLPMKITTRTWTRNKNSVSIDRGPLTYSLKIEERVVPFDGIEGWPLIEIFPTTPWNYGLTSTDFEVVKKEGPLGAQPFDVKGAPIELIGRGKRIPNWQTDRNGLIGVLQPSPARSDQAEEKITLIPMGCARLRITAFPMIGEGPDAREWTAPPPPPHAASHEFDDINALSDKKIPQKSSDAGIPRFTWWDHKGTREWVTYDFEKPLKVGASSVYWFDDAATGGQCRVPRSWKLFVKQGDEYVEVKGASGFGTKPDQWNRVDFTPVWTTSLKLEVQLQDGFSGGILEWTFEQAKLRRGND